MKETLNNHEQQEENSSASEWSGFPPFDAVKAQAAQDRMRESLGLEPSGDSEEGVGEGERTYTDEEVRSILSDPARVSTLDYDKTLYASPNEYLMAHTKKAEERRDKIGEHLKADTQDESPQELRRDNDSSIFGATVETQEEVAETEESNEINESNETIDKIEQLGPDKLGMSLEEAKFVLGLADKNVNDSRALLATVRGARSLEELSAAIVQLSENDRQDFGTLSDTLMQAQDLEQVTQMNLAVSSESERRCVMQLNVAKRLKDNVLAMSLPPALKSNIMTRVQEIENQVGAIYNVVSGKNEGEKTPDVPKEKLQQDEAEQRAILNEM